MKKKTNKDLIKSVHKSCGRLKTKAPKVIDPKTVYKRKDKHKKKIEGE